MRTLRVIRSCINVASGIFLAGMGAAVFRTAIDGWDSVPGDLAPWLVVWGVSCVVGSYRCIYDPTIDSPDNSD